MSKIKSLEELYKDIFGSKFIGFDLTSAVNQAVHSKSTIEDKCVLCKYQNVSCPSFKNRQDLPFFKNIEQVDTMVIAEAPGKGIEEGVLGSVFGLHNFLSPKAISLKDKYYYNYFDRILGLDMDRTYITDCLKCYTDKSDLNKSFKFCSAFLKKEIELLNPKKILWITKQVDVFEFINKNNLQEISTIIPHPSNQNLSKIPTVAEIFDSIGEIQQSEHLKRIAKEIKDVYNEWRAKLR